MPGISPLAEETPYIFLENLPVGICITDLDLNVEFWNNRLEKWSDMIKAEVHGQRLTNLFPNLLESKYQNRIRQVVSGGPAALFSSQLHPHLIPLKFQDGSYRIQNSTVNLFQGTDGLAKLMFAIQDVTETYRHIRRIKDLRKQALNEIGEREEAEAALRTSEERYRSIFENSPLGILQFDAHGKILNANGILVHVLELELDEIIGKNIIDLLPLDLLKQAQKATYGQPTHFEGSYPVSSGKRTYLEVNFSPLRSALGNVISGAVGIFENVTSRVEAQQELRRNQELLSSITKNIRDGIYRSVVGQGFIYVNESFARMMGGSRSDFEGLEIRQFFEDKNQHDVLDAKIAYRGSIENEEISIRRLDGRQFWGLMSVAAAYDPNGQILYYDGAITDITDRKLDNERLKESEEQYRNLFQNSRAGMYRCDIRTGRILKANKKALNIFGYNENETISTKRIFRKARDWKTVSNLLVKFGEFENMEFETVHSDGAPIWIALSAKHFPDDDYFEGVVIDITERRRAELLQSALYRIADKTAAMLSFKEYLEQIKSIISELIYADNIVVAEIDDASKEFQFRILKDKQYKEKNKSWDKSTLVQSSFDADEVLLLSAANFDEHIRKYHIEVEKQHSVENWLSAPLKTPNQKMGIVALWSYDKKHKYDEHDKEVLTFIAQHISTALDRKRNEEQMRQALELAKAASKAKSQFLANMSHELRTPLNSIIGFNRRILSKAQNTMDESSIMALKTVRRNAESLLNMINDILDISKVEAGKYSFRFRNVDISQIAGLVCEELEPLASHKSLYLKIDRHKRCIAKTDADRLKQVLINMVGNAIKFTEEGGVTLICDSLDDVVHLSVVDTGVGIPNEKLGVIFDVFEQANHERDSGKGGTGLGLAIAQRLVEGMNGTISVSSKLGIGTTFKIMLPKAEEKLNSSSAY